MNCKYALTLNRFIIAIQFKHSRSRQDGKRYGYKVQRKRFYFFRFSILTILRGYHFNIFRRNWGKRKKQYYIKLNVMWKKSKTTTTAPNISRLFASIKFLHNKQSNFKKVLHLDTKSEEIKEVRDKNIVSPLYIAA